MPTPKSVRLDLTLYEKIEAYRAHLSNITGLQVNLSTAIRKLVELGLEQVSVPPKRRR